jgi:hypothetical protein
MNEETEIEGPYRKSKSVNVYELTSQMFDEMLEHVKPLLTMKWGCSESQIKKQCRNVPEKTIESFLAEAMKRGIIKEEPVGTFALRRIEIQVYRTIFAYQDST